MLGYRRGTPHHLVYDKENYAVTVALPPVAELPNIRRRWVMLMLTVFGLMSLAAVVTAIPSIGEPKFECHPQVLTADDGVTALTADDGRTLLSTGLQECQAEPADHWVPLPAWSRGILRWIGAPT
jgi:hypothetical protein